MSEVTTVGLDLAKNVFQLHGADACGRAVLRRKLRRGQVLEALTGCSRYTAATEACGGAHFWGREIGKLGHEVRVIPPAYVKPFVRRQRNDAADAEAIGEPAQRPNMRFVPVKNEEKRGAAAVFRVRELLVRQRKQTLNALRGHLTEFGEVVPQGTWNARRLAELVEAEDDALPETTRATLQELVDGLRHLDERIATLAPPPEHFRRARDFAVWLGLTPRQHSTGGKQRLGATTRMGSDRSNGS